MTRKKNKIIKKNKKAPHKKEKVKKISLLLNKVYDNFKKKQKINEKKEIKFREEQIKKELEKIKIIEKEFKIKDRAELSKKMYNSMVKYGGIGLSANQVGLPYRMFIMGGHPSIENGKIRSVFNPLINDVSKETVMMKEGCLSFPFLFLSITRPKWCHVKYTDQHGKDVEEVLHGMNARIFQHENEHMNGYVFTDLVSKMKLDRAKEARKKMLKKYARGGAIR